MDPAELLRQYNEIMAHYGRRRRRPDTRAQAEAATFLGWCREREVDPVRFMRARMEAVQGRMRIPLRAMGSEKFLGTFRQWGDLHQAAAQGQERLRRDEQVASPPVTLFEAMRRALVGSPMLCAVDPMTGGYSTCSPTCLACQIWEACRDRRQRVRA